MRALGLATTLPLVCSAALLLACSTQATYLPRTDATVAPSPSPSPASSAAAAAADALYLRGRDLHLARRYGAAIAAYQAALQAEGAHLNAKNGLAAAYAEQGDVAAAIAIWRALTANATLASGAGRAFLFVNLGYAYLLAGDVDAARIALEKACLLDPLDGRAWRYLGETLARLGDEARARQMLHQAELLRSHDFRADYASAARGARLPAIEQALDQGARADQDSGNDSASEGGWAVDQVTRNASGVFELHRLPASGAPVHILPASASASASVPAPAPAPAPAPHVGVALLEISNGNGRRGMVHRLARQLRDPGVKVVRLTNEKNFAVRQTRVEYRPALRAAAERLASRLGPGQPVLLATAARIDLRLVIGRDLPYRPTGPMGMTPATTAPQKLPLNQQ